MQARRQDGPLADVSVQANVNLSTEVDVGNDSGVDVSITTQLGSNRNLVLNTTSGLFSGAYDKDRKQYRWLAIPYAASTAGDNRWKPAQPFVPSKALLKTPRPATSFGQSCPQFVTRASQTGLAWSGTVSPSNQGEDCLSISIFTSSAVRQNATRPDDAGSPIFVWLYGGSFLFGSQENKLIDPAPILARHPDVGKFAKVPILLGTNDQEGTILCASQSDLANNLYNDVALPFTFVCPATTEASDRIKAGVPAWQYKYGANWDDINSGRKSLGAYHQAEIPLLFGNFDTTPIAVATGANAGPHQVSVPDAQREVSRFMMDAWMSFVRDPQHGPTTLAAPSPTLDQSIQSKHASLWA
ncbi:Carboxylesterase and related proteins [Ceraceosorus bombacis]|uniref:Carboxylesterase and related proteins n=1 Tax=Ceraceosorus bombacis TaxID=401625 RepID=A0A0P1BT01_9BASI|nr:Carboxylesterase and related proteins [Ceraceosorus bombacis]